MRHLLGAPPPQSPPPAAPTAAAAAPVAEIAPPYATLVPGPDDEAPASIEKATVWVREALTGDDKGRPEAGTGTGTGICGTMNAFQAAVTGLEAWLKKAFTTAIPALCLAANGMAGLVSCRTDEENPSRQD